MQVNKNGGRLFSVVLASLFAASVLYAANLQPAKSQGGLNFYLDTASFRSSVQNTYQEFYYQVPLQELLFAKKGRLRIDTLDIVFDLKDAQGKVVYSDTWSAPVVADKKQELRGRFIPSQFDLLLPPGPYWAVMKITERSSQRSGVARLSFEAPGFDQSTLSISSIQFASDARRDTTNGRGKFTKNGLYILPNPARTYGIVLPMLVFYFEIYNLSAPDSSDSTFEIHYALLNSAGNVARTLPAKIRKKKGTSSVQVGAISVAALNDTIYTLKLQVIDKASGLTAERSALFRNLPVTYRSKSPMNEVVMMINRMTPKDLKLHIRQCKYIMTKEEQDILKNLDEDGKKKAMIEFWNRHDPDTSTPQNEFFREYLNRIKIANQQYSRGFEPGWLSDRGRILIKYGMPSDIERHPMSVDSRPYEVWYYQRGRGYKFIFLDEEGFNRYRLIYSNMEGEIGDPNWQQLIQYR